MNSQRLSRKLLGCLLLGMLGYAGNWLKLELFFNVDFLFGSFFVMLAILMVGGGYGAIAGLIAAAYTYLFWNYPWGIVILGGEALFVGLVYSRRKGNLIFYDMIYWTVLGMPLVYLFFHHFMAIPIQSTALIMLKQALNGALNALTATLVFIGINLRKNAAKGPITYSQSIFTVMVSLVLMPAMLIYVLGTRAYLEKEKEALAARLFYTAEIARSSLANWINEHHQNVQTLAAIIGDPDRTPIEDMQERVEMIKAASPAFNRMGVLDKNAITIAYSPLKDENGKSNLGIDFSDRPFIPVLKETKRPYVSGVVMGRIGKPAPMVPLLAPILVAGEYKGYCTGIVELPQVSNLISILASREGYNITVVDNKGKVVTSTIPSLKVMEPFGRPYTQAGTMSTAELLHWIPTPQPGISIMQRWTNSLLVKAVVINPDYAWKVIVEAPMLPVVESVSRQSIHWLALLCVLAIVTMILSRLFSGAFVSTIAKLREMTRTFPCLIDKVGEMAWPESKMIELEELSNNFRDMSIALSDSFQKQKNLNESLEEKVLDRTNELKEREVFIRDVLDSLTAHVAVLDHQGEIVSVNEAWMRFARENNGGKDSLLGVGTNYFTVCKRSIESGGDEEISSALRGIQAVLDGSQEHFSMEYPCHSPDEQRWFSMRVSRLHGSRQGAVVAHENITGRIQMENALRRSEEKYRHIVEHAVEGIFQSTPEGAFLSVNPAFARMFGFDSPRQMVREVHNIAEQLYLHPEDRLRVQELMKAEGRILGLEVEMKRKEGDTFWMSLNSRCVCDPNGIVLYYDGFVSDISDRKRAEEALRNEQTTLRGILDAAKESIWLFTPEGFVITANEIAFRRFNKPAEEVVGRHYSDISRAELAQSRLAHLKNSVESGKVVEFEDQRDGIFFHHTLYPVLNDGERVSSVVCFSRDITERKQAEEERIRMELRFHQVQKAESLGRMAGAIAHNFNNILGAVIGNLDLALDDTPDGSELHTIIMDALNASHRAAEISRFMLTYVGQIHGKAEPIDPVLLLREACAVLSATLPADVLLKSERSTPGRFVQADSAHLTQILSSLVSNAAEAMGKNGGEITVAMQAVAGAEIEELRLFPPGWKPDAKEYFCLSVADNGHGMDEATLNEIFDPFFSTKFTGRGLGLSVVLGLVRGLNGAIAVRSSVDAGSIFKVFLPTLEKPPRLPSLRP